MTAAFQSTSVIQTCLTPMFAGRQTRQLLFYKHKSLSLPCRAAEISLRGCCFQRCCEVFQHRWDSLMWRNRAKNAECKPWFRVNQIELFGSFLQDFRVFLACQTVTRCRSVQLSCLVQLKPPLRGEVLFSPCAPPGRLRLALSVVGSRRLHSACWFNTLIKPRQE